MFGFSDQHRRHRLSLLIPLMLVCSLIAPFFIAHDPFAMNPAQQFQPPGRAFLLGADQFGRDMLARTLWGTRRTLAGAMLATGVALILGPLFGLLAGLDERWLDWAIMRLVDALLAVPAILLGMVSVTIWGTGLLPVSIGVGIGLIPGVTRVVRGAAITVRRQGWIEASRALGASEFRIIIKHVIPHVLNILLAYGASVFAWSVLNIAALEYLGLGGSPSEPSLGRLLFDGRVYFRRAPWIAIVAGSVTTFIILVTTIGLIPVDHPVDTKNAARGWRRFLLRRRRRPRL